MRHGIDCDCLFTDEEIEQDKRIKEERRKLFEEYGLPIDHQQ